MHAKIALAVAGSALALPSAAQAASVRHDSLPVGFDALHPSGKLTHNEALDDRLVRTNVRYSKRLDRKPHVRRLRTLPVSVLRERNRRLHKRVARVVRREHAEAAAAAAPAASAPLQAIAACESGGNPATNTGNGFYGKYQFTASTWASVGGTGNPAAASEAEQDRRAAMLYARSGSSPWPVCGR